MLYDMCSFFCFATQFNNLRTRNSINSTIVQRIELNLIGCKLVAHPDGGGWHLYTYLIVNRVEAGSYIKECTLMRRV